MGFAQLGVFRTGKGIPEVEFPKSNLWGTTFTISVGSRYHCTIIYLIFSFESIFPFLLNKFSLKGEFSLKGDFYCCHKWKISNTCHKERVTVQINTTKTKQRS